MLPNPKVWEWHSNRNAYGVGCHSKAQTRAPQPRHAYMYTRHNHNKHATQHNAYKPVAQTYQNTHCHCQCMSHTMTQKSYRNHSHHNTQGMFHTLAKHLGEKNLPMLNVFIAWPKVTLAMCAFIKDWT